MSNKDSYWQSRQLGRPVDGSVDALRGAIDSKYDRPLPTPIERTPEQEAAFAKELGGILKTTALLTVGLLMFPFANAVIRDITEPFSDYFNDRTDAIPVVSLFQGRPVLKGTEIPAKPQQKRAHVIMANQLAEYYNTQSAIKNEGTLRASHKALTAAISNRKNHKEDHFIHREGRFISHFEREYAQQKDAPQGEPVRSLFCLENKNHEVLYLAWSETTANNVFRLRDISKPELWRIIGCDSGLNLLRSRVREYRPGQP